MQHVPARFRFLSIFVGLSVIAGCPGSSEQPRPVDVDAGTHKGPTIGVSQFSLDDPRHEQMKADVEAQAKEYPDLSLIFKNAEGDVQKQADQIEELIGERVNAIIVSPGDAQLMTAPVAKAFDAGITVIVLDRAIVGAKYNCFIAVDNEALGRAAGRWLAEELGGVGKIVELKGPVDAAHANDRHREFRNAINHPGFRVVAEVPVDWKESKARDEMAKLLARYDDVDAVFAHNDQGAHGAFLAAKEAGREQGILFVGIGGLPKIGIRYLRSGELSATFEYPTGGNDAVELAMKLLSGQEVPKHHMLRSRIFTPDNIDTGGDPID